MGTNRTLYQVARTILLVEDSLVESELVRRTLAGGGYRVTLAHNGQEAMEAMRTAPPDLVMTDIRMPIMDGYELCRAIKRDPALAHIPVILLSVLSEPEDIIQAIDVRADSYTTKPYTDASLLGRLGSLLSTPSRSQRKPGEPLVVEYRDKVYHIDADPQQMLNLLLSVYENTMAQNRELMAVQAQLSLLNENLEEKVRQRTAALQESEARFRATFEQAAVGIAHVAPDGRWLRVNQRLCHLVGYTPEEMLAMSCKELIHPDDVHDSLAGMRQLLAGETGSHRQQKRYLRKDRESLWVYETLALVRLADGNPDYFISVMEDISERKAAQDALILLNAELEQRVAARTAEQREARQAAEAANRAKSAFLTNMSHELRTPLNSILGYAQILERDAALDEPHAAKAKVIRKSGEHLLTLINDTLDLARIEAGKMELYPDEFLFHPFVQDIIDIAGVKAADKGLALVCDLDPDVPQRIRADGKRLRQVLLNLLSNAVKFTDRGQVALRVRFAPPDHWRFEVTDTGVGIAADQLKTIFEPFEQVGDRQHRAGGTGLGLTISRQYARLMGGDIRVESRPGQCSTFHVEIQAQPVDNATEAPMTAATASVRNVTGYAGPRKKVLVVDDIAENRAVMTDLLTPLGFEVIEAANGHEGLEAAQHLRPDLILMDIAMPQLDGMAATRLLRQSDICREVPIIAVSASVSASALASDSEQCLAAGMNAFLPKPLDADKLLDQMARLLQLEWTYRAAPSSAAGAMVAPPAEELEVLYRLARMGNMQDILERTAYLAELDPRYGPFVSQLRSLAKGYQSKAILSLVERCLHGVALPAQH